MRDRSKIEKNNPFRIPDNYFEEMSDTVITKVGLSSPIKKISFITALKPHLMLAAAMIGFAVISFLAIEFLIPNSESEKSEVNYAELTEYLSLEIDEASIVNEMLKADLGNESDISTEDIIEYLIETNIDYSEILENL